MSEEWKTHSHKMPAGSYKWRADEFYSRASNRDDHMLSPDWLDREMYAYKSLQKRVVYSRAPQNTIQPQTVQPRMKRASSLSSLSSGSLPSPMGRSPSNSALLRRPNSSPMSGSPKASLYYGGFSEAAQSPFASSGRRPALA